MTIRPLLKFHSDSDSSIGTSFELLSSSHSNQTISRFWLGALLCSSNECTDSWASGNCLSFQRFDGIRFGDRQRYQHILAQ